MAFYALAHARLSAHVTTYKHTRARARAHTSQPHVSVSIKSGLRITRWLECNLYMLECMWLAVARGNIFRLDTNTPHRCGFIHARARVKTSILRYTRQ